MDKKFWMAFLRLFLVSISLLVINFSLFMIYLYFQEKSKNPYIVYNKNWLGLLLVVIFCLNSIILFYFNKRYTFPKKALNLLIAAYTFGVVGYSLTILLDQSLNIETLTVTENNRKLKFTVGKVSVFEKKLSPNKVENNSLWLKKEDMLVILDDEAVDEKGKKVKFENRKNYVDEVKLYNNKITIQIFGLIAFTAPRLLAPIFLKSIED